jgi:hypothetical protein
MEKRLPIPSKFLSFAIVFVLLGAAVAAYAQATMPPPPLPSGNYEKSKPADPDIFDSYPAAPSLPPAFTIPVGPLGFSSPGVFYLLRRRSLVSLDFLDENHLLFTFQTAGLMGRDAANEEGAKERKIRAVVLSLPDGNVEGEAEWLVPDQSRYLWMLKNGNFLLHDTDGLEQGDRSLKTTPFLNLPGRLLFLQMDPTEQVMVTNSLEPGTAPPQSAGVTSPVRNLPDIDIPDNQPLPEAQGTLVVRTIQRASGQTIQTARVPFNNQTADWPITSSGYVDSFKSSKGMEWLLNLDSFAGGRKPVGSVDSICPPLLAYASETELMANTCVPNGGGKLVALSATGNQLWQAITGTNNMWPLLVAAPDGSRVARETLLLKRRSKRYKRLLTASDLQGQMARVYDAATGKVQLEAPLSPLLDAGGNLAFSPSGRRIAILNARTIQVFELPAATPFANPAKQP